MKKFNVLLLLLLSYSILNGQSSPSVSKNSLFLTIGYGFDDGLVSSSSIPTLGVGYERQFNNYFAAYLRLSSFYRIGVDSYYDYSDTNRSKIIDIIDKEGYEKFSSTKTIKSLSIPLMMGVVFTPLKWRRHSFSIYTGYGVVYERYNWWKDYYLPATNIDPTNPVNGAVFTLQTEYRHIIMGENINLRYKYQAKHFSSGVMFGESNTFFGPASSLSFWDLALFFKFEI